MQGKKRIISLPAMPKRHIEGDLSLYYLPNPVSSSRSESSDADGTSIMVHLSTRSIKKQRNRSITVLWLLTCIHCPKSCESTKTLLEIEP